MIIESQDFHSPINEPFQLQICPASFVSIEFDDNISIKSHFKKIDTCCLPFYHKPKSPLSNSGSFDHPNLLSKKIINRQQSSPAPIVPQLLSVSDSEFMTLCNDIEVKFNPKSLGFIPFSFWNDEEVTFGYLVENYFRKKNNPNCHFFMKLYNALLITTDDPFYAEFLGVEWITDSILRIDKYVFSRLFGLKQPDSSLFHSHGFFSTYGFAEVSPNEAASLAPQIDLSEIDFDNVRLLIHKDKIFTKSCSCDNLFEYMQKFNAFVGIKCL